MISELWKIQFEHRTLGKVKLSGMRKPKTDEDMQSLLSSNVSGVVSLLDNEENQRLYEKHGVDFLWLPVKGGKSPSLAQIQKADDYIIKLLGNNSELTVSTHCNGGRKRTGTLLAGVMIINGISPEEAVLKVEQANPEIKLKSEQINFLQSLV